MGGGNNSRLAAKPTAPQIRSGMLNTCCPFLPRPSTCSTLGKLDSLRLRCLTRSCSFSWLCSPTSTSLLFSSSRDASRSTSCRAAVVAATYAANTRVLGAAYSALKESRRLRISLEGSRMMTSTTRGVSSSGGAYARVNTEGTTVGTTRGYASS